MWKYLYSIIFGFFLVIFGIVLTVSEAADFSVSDTFINGTIDKNNLTYNIIKTQDMIEINTKDTQDPTISFDNTIAIGTAKIVVSYYGEYVKIDESVVIQDNKDNVYIDASYNNRFNNLKGFFKVSIEGLKNKTVYNYEKALSPDVKIIINGADKEIVKIGK